MDAALSKARLGGLHLSALAQLGQHAGQLRVLGRCGPLLQLAAKRPARRARGAGDDGDGGVHAQRRNLECRLDGGQPQRRPTYFIPSENEWYKAAYYDPTLNGGTGGYWTYPTKTNTAPVNILSSIGTNNANFYDY